MTTNVLKRNNVRIRGTGSQAIIFAHGFGCDQNMWRYVSPAFESDYKVILFDYVGAGKSDLSSYNRSRYNSLSGYALDLLEVCRTLNLLNVIFVGHSVSSMIGVTAAIESPELFSRIIMIGPSPCYVNQDGYVGGFAKADLESLFDTMDKNYIGWANFLGPVVMANADRPELATELTDSFCSTDPIIARQFAEVTFFSDSREDLPKMTVPSLILQCSEDIIAPLVVGQYVAEQLPNNQFIQLKATGHCPHLSEPVETILAIKNYLSAI